jgi:ATP-dependent DNA helicase RecG
MNPETILRLIEGGESLDVEFKGEERRPLPDEELVEAVVCLANRRSETPAWLLLGVEDDGRVTGARPICANLMGCGRGMRALNCWHGRACSCW